MKKINLLFVILLSLIITSCSSDDKDILSLIPEDATAVVGINVKSLIKKSGISLNNDGSLKIPDSFKSILQDNKNDYEFFKELPNSGIDFDNNAFMFCTSTDFDFALLIRLKDSENFEKFLSKYAKERIKVNSDYKYYVANSRIIMFSQKTLLIAYKNNNTGNDDLIEKGISVFKAKTKNFTNNKDAISFLDNSDDMLAYINYKKLGSNLQYLLQDKGSIGQIQMAQELFGSIDAATFRLNFNKDNVSVNGECKTQKNSEYITICEKIIDKPSSEFLKLYPANIDNIMSISINGKGLMEIEELKNIIGKLAANPLIPINDIVTVIENINGPISFGSKMSQDINTSGYMLSVKTKDANHLISTLKNALSLFGIPLTKNGTAYSCVFDEMKITMGEQDGYVYLKSNFDVKSTDVAYSNDVLRNLYSKSSGGMYFNLESGAKLMLGNNDYKGYITSGMTSPKDFDAMLMITEPKSTNSLQTILELSFKADSIGNAKTIDNPDIDIMAEPIDKMEPVE